ncbi:MAG TPA: sulfatase-like hydrolase/transferase [Polyangiaceae bacterium]|nr:sulfatase-like hydrolase/transferase [Polyangiaceae bacterium]
MASLRYPGEDTRLWYLPCIDTVVLLGAFALVARSGRRVSRVLLALVALLFWLVRLFRIGDAFSQHFFRQAFNLYVNLSLLPELPRLLLTTMPAFRFALLATAIVGGALLALLLTYAALRVAERCLLERPNRHLFAGVAVAFVALSLTPRTGPFAAVRPMAGCASARLVTEASATLHAHSAYERERRAVADARARLKHMSTDLAKLEGADVLLFIVESYGETLLEDPAYTPRIQPELAAFDRELGALGYHIASNVLDSPTFGGRSWFAHAALDSGVKVENQLEYQSLCSQKPLTIADFFRAAGYRTVLAQPATERPLGPSDYLEFDQKYLAASFDYRGPEFGWGRMPDQFAIDFVHRHELTTHDKPRFVEYALVSSHTPWLAEPSVLDDWSRVGDGSVLGALPITHHDVDWSNVDRASDAYLDAVVYDLEVLRRYLASELHNDTLVVIVGDHQPPGGAARSSTGAGVPIHVLSRKAGLVAPFLARGYAAGMAPRVSPPHPGMQTFLFSFLRDFSADLRQTSTVTPAGRATSAAGEPTP